MPPPKTWTIEAAESLYNLEGWGLNYFGINAKGNVTLQPKKDPEGAIDILDVVNDVASRNIKMPVLIRFQDILRRRVAVINEAFADAIKEHGYGGRFFGVYPIKVNQFREVVEEISDAGRAWQYGLEAGSKGELLAVLAMNSGDSLTIVELAGLKVLAVTGRVPNEPVIFRRGLDEKKRQAIEAAFISLAAKPECRKALGALADITGFKPADPSVYRPLHELLRSEGKAVYDLVPQGWEIHRLNQPYSDER